MSEQIEYALVAVDAATRKPVNMAGSFAMPPREPGPAELHAHCMLCDRRGTTRADGMKPSDHGAKLAAARKLLRESGCPHVHT